MKTIARKVLIGFIAFAPYVTLSAFAGCGDAADMDREDVEIDDVDDAVTASPNSVFNNLDYGLYWFGPNNHSQKWTAGQANQYYNPSKPTVIYIHGWQKGSTKMKTRETFNRSGSGGPDLDLAQSWLGDGYNVGILYWNQFADEDEVKDAEAKIWTATGPRAMRWRNANGNYGTGPTLSVGELLFRDYRDALAGYQGSNIRLLGHSLGNQLAIVIAKKVSDAIAAGTMGSNLLPKRLALLDPFYSNQPKSYLDNKWAGEVCRNYVTALKGKGVIFEAYRTSAVANTIFVGDANTELMKMTAFTELKPWYFNTIQQREKHNAAVWHYLWSYDFNAPEIEGTVTKASSASTSDARIMQLMNGNEKMVQVQGSYTKDPSDDTFKAAAR